MRPEDRVGNTRDRPVGHELVDDRELGDTIVRG